MLRSRVSLSPPRAAALVALVTPPLVLLPAAARAQGAIAFDQVARAVAPGSWRYTSKATANGQSTDVGSRRLTLERRGAGGWLLLDQLQNPTAEAVDSLHLAGDDLATERRSIHARTLGGTATVTMQFGRDSIVGSVVTPGQTVPLRLSNPRGALASDGVLLVALGRLPLARAWSGTTSLLNPQSGTTVPVALRVTGSESVTVPAGTFDAWVVTANAAGSATTFWVAKGGPVVRILARGPQMAGGELESVLAR